MAKNKLWIQRVVKRPGRVQRYIMRKYGTKAFNKDGTIKMKYLLMAKKEVVEKTDNRSLISALNLAIRLKRMKRRK